MSKRLKLINDALRQAKTVNVEVTVTTVSGATETRQFAVRKNRLNKIGGSGLSSQQIHSLIKNGETESVDASGNVYSWRVIELSQSPVEQNVEAVEELQELAAEAE